MMMGAWLRDELLVYKSPYLRGSRVVEYKITNEKTDKD